MDNATNRSRPTLSDPIEYALIKSIYFPSDAVDGDVDERLMRQRSQFRNNQSKR